MLHTIQAELFQLIRSKLFLDNRGSALPPHLR